MAPIPEYVGNVFEAPEGSVLIHACNCFGSWGSGVAAAIRAKFPAAYEVYREHYLVPDTMHHKKKIVATALLIPPQDADIEASGRYWIACLFTSVHYGPRKDKPGVILENTRHALLSLRQKIVEAQKQVPNLKLTDKLYTVRINAAAFNTPWQDTRRLLEQSGLGIVVLNNLEVMRQPERDGVVQSMTQNGFDIEAPPPWRGSASTTTSTAPKES